ncbi:unnamed protein product [Timema podura]|uniref:Protein FAM177A1 n=1 Tax=Timema podura TaxID=61482 RepID=A0ABN7NVH0_TIMPD|nr:unnamed protein product [Timema podura]
MDGLDELIGQFTNVWCKKTLTWGPWTLYHVATAGSKTLQVCDYLGESLANFFGITTPKYQYEIDEYHRMLAEEEERQRQLDLEMGGWTDKSSQQVISLQEVTQPSSTSEVQQAGDGHSSQLIGTRLFSLVKESVTKLMFGIISVINTSNQRQYQERDNTLVI